MFLSDLNKCNFTFNSSDARNEIEVQGKEYQISKIFDCQTVKWLLTAFPTSFTINRKVFTLWSTRNAFQKVEFDIKTIENWRLLILRQAFSQDWVKFLLKMTFFNFRLCLKQFEELSLISFEFDNPSDEFPFSP